MLNFYFYYIYIYIYKIAVNLKRYTGTEIYRSADQTGTTSDKDGARGG